VTRLCPRLAPRLVAWLVARFDAPRLIATRLAPRLDATRLAPRLDSTRLTPRLDSTRLRVTRAGQHLGLLFPRLRFHGTFLVALPIATTFDAAAVNTTTRAIVRTAGAHDSTPSITTIANVRRRNDSQTTQIPARDTATRVVVDRTLALAGDKSVAVRLRGAPVLEDEPWLRTIGANEHHATAAIRPVRIVPGIVVDIHAEADTRRVVRIPVRVADVAVAIVAQERG
jgi:hypothetical protein